MIISARTWKCEVHPSTRWKTVPMVVSSCSLRDGGYFCAADGFSFVRPNSYAETIEFIDSVRQAPTKSPNGPVSRQNRSKEAASEDSPDRFLYTAFALRRRSACSRVLRFDSLRHDLFCRGSGRIGRVLRCARTAMVPVVMVRSHTKLDSRGV